MKAQTIYIKNLISVVETGKAKLSKDEIYNLYFVKMKSCKSIGHVLEVSYQTMHKLFDYWEWKLRPVGNFSGRVNDKPFIEVLAKILTDAEMELEIETAIYK